MKRAKRIVDRRIKGEISEDEKPLLTIIANVIAQIAIIQMSSAEEIENNHELLNKTITSKKKQRT